MKVRDREAAPIKFCNSRAGRSELKIQRVSWQANINSKSEGHAQAGEHAYDREQVEV